ncbi:YcjF family protein [Crocosphaera watsonii]|uniref:Small GTP-binding protein domain n=1 Tax=Crocosphaera watsonii WH 8502 TaxID=423474 RepID=T2IGP0_CROWT|nr:GTP-binding protein [Crocosphaera watsonii]CCQ52203.1 Small GTP-binding protein domain [Crocosphaera watsonii WH 8502]
MPTHRLIILIIGLSIILGLVIWLITSIYRLYIQISFTAPLLANFLVFMIMGLLGLLIYGFIYYFNIFSSEGSHRYKKRRPQLKLPEQKTEAAQENLQAIRRQLETIQDKVAQKALLNRSQEITDNLNRGELKVVIFGTGSAGKTSLVNALFGDIVGDVEATMGTTKIGETYSLKLKGISREILITDTPGILEAGIEGSERETLARQLATEADLLLFVVDNDLRQSEYNPLEILVNLGKRSLLIFNKIDLYTEEEENQILEQLKERVKSIIAEKDVISLSAKPQSITSQNGEKVQPLPNITPLIKRLAAILRAEGEDLIADNILLQSQRLGEEARKLIDRQRKRQSEQVIDRYQWISAGVIAVTPLPVVDMLATAAVNAQMVMEIGQVYGCEINSDRGKELALSLGKTLVSLGVVKGAVDLLGRVLQLNIATYLVGKVIQGVTAAYLTRIAGKSFVEYFRQDQDWGDGGITEVVQRQFQLSRKDEFLKAFVQDAISKVVQPLSDSWEEDREDIEPVKQPPIQQKAVLEEQEDDW